MTCFEPLIRVENLSKWEKGQDGHLYHPAKIESSKNLENYDFYNSPYYKIQQINCGKCIGCRLDYSREWANRGYLESLSYEHNYFITLTYDDEHIFIPDEITTKNEITYTELPELPWMGSIVPAEVTKFMKALRQEFKRKYSHDGIRFMACGEYGTERGRPHYHLILFNCPFPLETFYNPRIDWENNIYYQNKILEKCWKKGISNITESSWNSIAYVARYITKKIKGKHSDEFYAIQGKEKEFFRTSRNPGIGYKYFEEHKEEIYKYDEIMIKNKKGIHYVKPPKYYDKMMEREAPELMKKIKEERRRENINKLKLKGMTTSLNRWEQLQVEKSTKEETTKALKRSFEKGEK